MSKYFIRLLILPFEPIIFIGLLILACIARLKPKAIDIGLGPLPLINNIYHKKVFEKCGYSAETFVNQVWHITSDFDVRGDEHPIHKIPVFGPRLNTLRLTVWCFFRYRCLLIYFNGGALGVTNTFLLWRLEPFLLNVAGVKTIVLGYGGDVQVMSRSPNLNFKDAMSKDYPRHCKNHQRIAGKIDLWTEHGSHVVGGCEWVDYMHHWDSLMISHFSIDVDDWLPDAKENSVNTGTFKVFHAPNHRNIKGTAHIVNAVEALKAEGLDMELVLAEKRPNHEIRALIKESDVIVDQLIIGWYAMFAIEAMALEKPVICYLRDDLKNLYRTAGLYDVDESIPLINANPQTIKDTLQSLYEERDKLPKIGRSGREYVIKHHSVDAIADVFGTILADILPKNNRIDDVR